jgi:hypothetical protein
LLGRDGYSGIHAWQLIEKRAEATSEAQDIVALTAVLSTVLFADCTVEPFFNKLLALRHAAYAAGLRLGRRTVRTFPLLPPPQKNRSPPSDSRPEM